MRPTEILYVEDDDDTRELMAMLIERYGYLVRTASTMGVARRLIAQSVPDVVMTDLRMMGGDSGWDFARSLRADSRTRDVPLVALTGDSPVDGEPTEPFDAIVVKPAEISALIALIERLTKSREARPDT
jgi:CheY-like chemotaxis protein